MEELTNIRGFAIDSTYEREKDMMIITMEERFKAEKIQLREKVRGIRRKEKDVLRHRSFREREE